MSTLTSMAIFATSRAILLFTFLTSACTGITFQSGDALKFNSHVLQSQNLLAIVSKMRAQRADKLIALQSGMYQNATGTNPPAATPLVRYSVDQRLIDLSAYYQAGTFVSALQDIVDKEKAKAEKTVNELKGIEKADD